MQQDEEHLKLLSIFHYVVGGMVGLFSLFPIFHLIMGLVFILAPSTTESGGGAPPAFIGWIFVIFAGVFIAIGMSFAACIISAGVSLGRHKNYMFCFVMAAIECIFMPFGTVLGIFTIVVLSKPAVKELFNGTSQGGTRTP